MPDPASTKQTTADLERWRKANGITGPREDNRLAFYVAHLKGGPCLNPTCATCIEIADALEALATDNARLRGIEQRVIREIEFLRVYEKSLDPEGRRHLRYLNRILQSDANAGGGE